MSNLKNEAVYKLNFDCGRQGKLEGLFIAKKDHAKWLIENEFEVYFGEVLGKHSEVYGSIDENEIAFVSDDLNVIDVIRKHGMENGYDPFDYNVINAEREDFKDLELSEIMVILEKENNLQIK